MKQLFAGIVTLTLLFLAFPPQTLRGQTGPVTAMPAGPLNYDPSQEVTLSGAETGLVTTTSAGTIPGAHLFLTTFSGSVDVSLGTVALQGKNAFSLEAGRQMEVTGVMKTVKGKPVFLARTVRTGDSVYQIRNAHGVPISPQARERASANSVRNEGSR